MLQFLSLQWLKTTPNFVETYYSNGWYLIVSSFFRILLGWIPFSIGDFLIFTLIFIVLRFIYILIKTKFKNPLNRFLQVISFVSIIYCCFYWFWGFNYYRSSLAKNLGFEQKKYTTEQLIKLSEYFVSELNKAHVSITKNDTIAINSPYNSKDFYKLALNGYEKLAIDYPQFTYNYPSVKSSSMSLIQTYNGTTGYLNPLTGEAQVNKNTPRTSYPTTTCHEIAHQIGIAAENEANFVAFLATVYNSDPYFQYAAYRMATRYTVFELHKRNPEKFKEVYGKLNKGILKDFKRSYEYWKSFENPFEPIVKKGYNAYLKANKQAKGVDSYNYVVDLFISYYQNRTDLEIFE